MAVYDYAISGKRAVTGHFAHCDMLLREGHTIAIRDGSRTAAAIIPWAAAEYLGGMDASGFFLEDARKLSCAPAMCASGPSGEIKRLNASEIAGMWPRVMGDVHDGTMVTFVFQRTARGLLVPPMVVSRLAGQAMPGDGEEHMQAGIRNVLRLEEDIRASPARRAQKGLRNPPAPR